MQDASDNLYAAPVADVWPPPAIPAAAAAFHVVSGPKLVVLYVATFGLYGIYWFYRHWEQVRRTGGETLWPVARAIFSVIFAHALAREIDARLHAGRRRYTWAPATVATCYVVFEIAGNILSRLSWREIGSPATDLLSMASMLPVVLCLLAMQRAANTASGDPTGEANSRFTAANWVWMILGGLAWLLVAAAWLLPG